MSVPTFLVHIHPLLDCPSNNDFFVIKQNITFSSPEEWEVESLKDLDNNLLTCAEIQVSY